MMDSEDRVGLEGLLGTEGLDLRAARVASAVESRLAAPRLLSVLGHPALAAAAAAATLIVWVGSGRSDSVGTHPSLAQILGIDSRIEQLESDLRVVLPRWIELDDEGRSR